MVNNQLHKRLEPIINAIDKSVICTSITNNLDGTYTMYTNDTAWLTTMFNVTIGLNTYKIVDFACNEWIKINGSTLPTQLTFDATAPIFKHGTILQVATELNLIDDFRNKYPLIFLHEIIDEKQHYAEVDAIDIDVDLRIYFLTECNFADWTSEIASIKGVQPMRNLYNRFIKAVVDSGKVAELDSIGTIRNYNRFGNTTDNGVIKNIFNEYQSGIQVRFNLQFLKECYCCDGNLDQRPAPAYVYDSLGNVLAVLYSNEIYVSTGGGTCEDVIIKNKETGETITTVSSGEEYEVTVLTEIRDTITSNTATIIDPITP